MTETQRRREREERDDRAREHEERRRRRDVADVERGAAEEQVPEVGWIP